MNEPKEKNITLPISRFIEYLVGTADKRYHIHPDDAKILALKDDDEQLCHVEFPDSENNTLTAPCVWKAKEWKTSYERHSRQKEYSAKQRQAANIFAANVDRVCARIANITGLDKERVRLTAIGIVRRGKKEELLKLGITIEEWDRNFNVTYVQ